MKNIIFIKLLLKQQLNSKMKHTALLLLLAIQAIAQLNNPSASASISFEQYAVDPSTGMPQISIPLYVMPTREKEVNINLQLNYHPSSVAVFNQEMGDSGHGWSLQKGGVIFKTLRGEPDEYSWANNANPINQQDLYEFRFMGYSGKFTVEKNAPNQFQVFVTENQGTPVKVDVEYDSTTSTISSFTIYNDSGFLYKFTLADEMVYHSAVYDNTVYKSAYHLTEIRNTNNVLLVNFNYNKYYRILSFHQSTELNIFNILSSIEVPGIGLIELTGLPVNLSSFLHASLSENPIRYYGIVIKDFLGNSIKEYHFEYEEEYIQENLRRTHLIKIDELNENITQTYHLEYKSIMHEDDLIIGYDQWGYSNLINKWCNTPDLSRLSSIYSTNGVLQKILLPTGGSIIYEYEQNTYSYTNNKALDRVYNSNTQSFEVDDNFYYSLNPLYKGNNLHNYDITNHAFKNFASDLGSVLPFTVNNSGTYYFKFDAVPDIVVIPEILDNDGNPLIVKVYPVFTLKKDGVTVHQFTISNQNLNLGYQNELNSGLGKDLELTSGNYTVEMSHNDVTTGSVHVNRIQPIPQQKKWWYGGGIRIKKVGYFSETVDRRYYQNNFSNPQPVNETTYNYNFFDEPNKSSGYMRNVIYEPYFYSPDEYNYTVVRYKNVTITNNGNNGKTEHVYYSPIDNLADAEYINDQRFGRLLETKVYNDTGNLLQSTEFDYDSTAPIRYSTSNVLIWNLPKTITTKEYLDGDVFETTLINEYNSDLKIQKTLQQTSHDNETISSKFYYNKNNTVFSKNRNAIERVENFRNNDLLSTSIINYSTTWPTIPEDNGATNVSYLPLTKEASKGETPFYTEQKVNLYDHYGNIVEFESQTGVKTVNIWGYNKTLLVAKLEKAAYSQIPQNLIIAIQSASDSGNETNLLTALENLRDETTLSGAMMTTYTYKPLVGISTETDYKGDKTTYSYDSLGRLESVKDADGNTLTQNNYHYRTQN